MKDIKVIKEPVAIECQYDDGDHLIVPYAELKEAPIGSEWCIGINHIDEFWTLLYRDDNGALVRYQNDTKSTVEIIYYQFQK